MYHLRKTRKRYEKYGRSQACDFCDPAQHSSTIIKETKHAYVIPNRTFYDHWETRRVTDHRMIIPKRHVLHLGELNADERKDVIDLMAEYESRGYQVYARSPDSVSRSIPHQHTHLIKTEHKDHRIMFFMRRPYILWLWR